MAKISEDTLVKVLVLVRDQIGRVQETLSNLDTNMDETRKAKELRESEECLTELEQRAKAHRIEHYVFMMEHYASRKEVVLAELKEMSDLYHTLKAAEF